MSSQAIPLSVINETVTSLNFIPCSPAGSQPLNAAINSAWYNESTNAIMVMTEHGWVPMTVNSDPDPINTLLIRAAEKSYHHLAVPPGRKNIASKALAITSSSLNTSTVKLELYANIRH